MFGDEYGNGERGSIPKQALEIGLTIGSALISSMVARYGNFHHRLYSAVTEATSHNGVNEIGSGPLQGVIQAGLTSSGAEHTPTEISSSRDSSSDGEPPFTNSISHW